MNEDNQIATIEKKVAKLFEKKTPKNAIKTRPGAGGLSFPYVDFGYVLSELDANFGLFWSFKITDKQITDKYVWVQGELIISALNGFSVSRPGTGGSKIKISKTTGEPVDIANDIKGATTLAIRKAASLYGIGADVAYKEIGIYEQSPDIQDEDEDSKKFIKDQVMKKFFAVAAERGFDGGKAKELIKTAFNVKHMEDLATEQLERAVKGLEAKYMVVMPGEEPLKIGELRKVDSDALEGSPETTELHNPEEVNIDEIKITHDCRKCGKVVPEGNDPEWFCDKKCQMEYWDNSGAKVV